MNDPKTCAYGHAKVPGDALGVCTRPRELPCLCGLLKARVPEPQLSGTTTGRISSHTPHFEEVGMQRAKRFEPDAVVSMDYRSLEERYWATASTEEISRAIEVTKAQWDSLTQRCPWDNFKPSKDIA